VVHNNAVERQFVAKFVFIGGSVCKGKTILERKTSVSRQRGLEQLYWHSNFPLPVDKAHKYIPTVQETPDSLLMTCFYAAIIPMFYATQHDWPGMRMEWAIHQTFSLHGLRMRLISNNKMSG